MAFEWEIKDQLVSSTSWEANDPIVSTPRTSPGATGSWEEDDPISIPARFGQHLVNVLSDIGKSIISHPLSPIGPPEREMRQYRKQVFEELSSTGFKGSAAQAEILVKQRTRELASAKKVPSFKIAPATNTVEKATDIAAGVTGFVAKLAVLKKAFPKLSGANLWEVENITSGGTPGVGYVTYGVFNTPGKIIKGATTAAKAGRLASESALLGGLSATHQKIATGEIDATEVLISAGIPLGLRVVGGAKGVLKRALKAKNPKAIKAVNEVIIKKAIADKGPITKAEQEVLRKAGFTVEEIGKAKPSELRAVMQAPERLVSGQTPGEVVQTANKQLLEWSKKAKEVAKDVKVPAIKELRARQAGRATGMLRRRLRKGESAYNAIKKSVFGYKDKANVPDITPPPLSEAQWEGYAKKILQLYPETSGKVQFQRTGTLKALDQLRKGKIPTNRQFELLEPLFGEKTTEGLYKELAKKRKFSGWDVPALTVQGLKSIFGLDIQVSRQASTTKWRHPIMFRKAQYHNVRAYASQNYANKARKALENSPGFAESVKQLNYIKTRGYQKSKRLEQFNMGFTELLADAKFKNSAIDKTFGKSFRAYGRLLRASERGAAAGINQMMKSLWDKGVRDLAQIPNITKAQQKIWLTNRAKTINTNMKILRAKHPRARQLQNAGNYLLFSPSVTFSRPLTIKALLANKGSRGYQAGVLASNIGSIFLTTAIPAFIAQQQLRQRPDEEPTMSGELNPLLSMWGKVRVGDEVFDFSGGDAPFYRTLARIGVSAYLSGQKTLTGKEQRTIAGKSVPSIGETATRYGESRETALIGLAKSLLTGKDFVGNPIPGWKALLRGVSPEVVTATVEAGLADGTWAALATGIATANSVGVSTYPVKAANTRSNFRDIIAQKAHNKRWNDLTLLEQRKLLVRNRKQFSALDEKVKAERIEQPFNPERIIEEERKSRTKIIKMLSKSNREKIKGISVAVSRRPKNFFLNDERYQQYQEATAKYLNERLSKLNLTGKSDKVRVKMLEVAVKIAKDKAFRDVRKGMR